MRAAGLRVLLKEARQLVLAAQAAGKRAARRLVAHGPEGVCNRAPVRLGQARKVGPPAPRVGVRVEFFPVRLELGGLFKYRVELRPVDPGAEPA